MKLTNFANYLLGYAQLMMKDFNNRQMTLGVVFASMICCVRYENIRDIGIKIENEAEFNEERESFSKDLCNVFGNDITLCIRKTLQEAKDEAYYYTGGAEAYNRFIQQLEGYGEAVAINSSQLLNTMLCLKYPMIEKHILKKGNENESVKNSFESMTDSQNNDENIIYGNKAYLQELTYEVKEIQRELSETVFGQDFAIDSFVSGYYEANIREKTGDNSEAPRAIFLFAGPTGVGKTLLAKQTAKAISKHSGVPVAFKKFDMSEYSFREASLTFAGSDSVYKNGKAGVLTSFVENHSRCVLLFDEIEKAHIEIIHLFLQILDSGRLRDTFTNKEVDFRQAIIIFTTNAGRSLYENSQGINLSALPREVILNAVMKDKKSDRSESVFPAEICSRLATGHIVMFNHMRAYNLVAIAKHNIMKSVENFRNTFGINAQIDDNIYTTLLLAEGANADARTINARSKAFYNEEMLELFRLMSTENPIMPITELKEVQFRVELPDNEEITALFNKNGKSKALAFAGKNSLSAIGSTENTEIIKTDNLAHAKELLSKDNIALVLCDLETGIKGDNGYLNADDIASDGLELFNYIIENESSTPVYIIGNNLSSEEQLSFSNHGARGFVTDDENINTAVDDICQIIYQQNNMISLARAHKIIKYNTAQKIDKSNGTAIITLYNHKIHTAIDSNDRDSVLDDISKPKVAFDDIIGSDDAKQELKYFVKYLKNPDMFRKMGLKAPKGVLLYGPSGTGKTMLAKATASESDLTFISVQGNDFFTQNGVEYAHRLFETARRYAPSILFIDEVDTFARKRTGSVLSKSEEAVLTAFLAEMDGFKTDSKRPVFVIAATNYTINQKSSYALDPAFVRRFDRSIYTELPDKADRIKYLATVINENNCICISDDDIENLAVRSAGMSLAQLDRVIELSLRLAIREERAVVDSELLNEALLTYCDGKKRETDTKTLDGIAVHESGHALIAYLCGRKPNYITIISRSNYGGYVSYSNENRQILSKEELISMVRISLAGRAAEQVLFGDNEGLTTGASSDLALATKIIEEMLCTYGMDDNFGLASRNSNSLTDAEIAAINQILQDEMQKTKQMISDNKTVIKQLAEMLKEKEHLSEKEIEEFFKLTLGDTNGE